MANEREQELERLEQELLSDISEDEDLLADMPIELLDTVPIQWEEEEPQFQEDSLPQEEIPEEPEEVISEVMKKSNERAKVAKKREDRYLITLMTIASFLCLGIIGILIYWLEAFLK